MAVWFSNMAKYTRTSGGVHCRAFNCNSGYYNHVEGQKKSLFNFPKDEERYVISHFYIT